MRLLSVLPFLTLCAVALAIDKAQVRKRFVLKLEHASQCDELCAQNVVRQLKALQYNSKSARCASIKRYRLLRMISTRCEAVNSAMLAFALAKKMADIPGVKSANEDALVSSFPTDSSATHPNAPSTPMFHPVQPTQRASRKTKWTPYNWGLDRIDQSHLPLDAQQPDFSCYPKLGAGVRVFVIDTGCKLNHEQFDDVRIEAFKAPDSDYVNGWDDHGHGTHIAAVIAGKNVGLARRASITCIKSFDQFGNGAAVDTINAVEYILEEKEKQPSVPFIVNLSYSALTGFSTTPLDELVYSASAHGIVFVVSAGNAGVNSCLFSPSKAEQAFTVAASTASDALEADTNIGPCVEFVAPGHQIVSAGIRSVTDYKSLNGTSMATPHIVGLSALVLAEHLYLQNDPATVRDTLYQMLVMTRNVVVGDLLMPLMRTGCVGPTVDPAEDEKEPDASAGEILPMPSPTSSSSPSPMPSPSPSPARIVPTLTQLPSPVGSQEPQESGEVLELNSSPCDAACWRERRNWEMKQDLGYEPEDAISVR